MPATRFHQFPANPPKEALAYFQAKKLKPSFDYRDVWREEHAYAFTIAKSTAGDILTDVYQAIEGALKEGKTFRQFQKELQPILEQKGWWGKQEVVDPKTGETVEAQLGSPRRLKTIYDANLRTARAAGQWQRIEKNKKVLPYVLYELGPSKEHRREHQSWAGTILPVDDPFWNSHTPPNGWGCKCRIRNLTEWELQKRGGKVSPSPPIQKVTWHNQRTGFTENIPQGIDPGWDTNPGKTRFQNLLKNTTDKLNEYPTPLAVASVASLLKGEAFRQWYQEGQQGNFPIGRLSEADAKKISAKTQTVVLSQATLDKQKRHHPDLDLQDYFVVQETLDRGEKIPTKENHYAYVLDEGQKGYVSVVKITIEKDTLFLVSFRKLSKSQKNKDREVRRLRKMAKKDE